MLGAIIGDIVGSRFEFNNHKSKDFDLFTEDCFFTDDTVMTLAVARAILDYQQGDYNTIESAFVDENKFKESVIKWMQKLGRHYPCCGYGGKFIEWMYEDNPQPYNSFGNGSAMRVGSVGFYASSLPETIRLSRLVTEVSHNHYEGIKGAEATSVCVFLANNGNKKDEIKRIVEKYYYKLNFTLDDIRDTYQFNETCQNTVPQAIEAFLESTDFEDAIRNAISIGGDSDTIAAITGSIAEAYYGVPNRLQKKAESYLDERLLNVYNEIGWY